MTRSHIVRFRFRRHQLDRGPGSAAEPADVALLDYGVQDTGPDGASWALALRGLAGGSPNDLALAWTLRGAPHLYRRPDLGAVAVATAPLSEADAAKRVYDAAKPLRDAGIGVLDALRTVAGHLRELAVEPITKGDASTALTARLDSAYLRWCRGCGATHIYEQPFRLAALQAGLELQRGTSPPVLQRMLGLQPPLYDRSGSEAHDRFDVIRNHLRFYGPARPRDVAAFLDAPLPEINAHWPGDAIEVPVEGRASGRGRGPSILAEDADLVASADADASGLVRLLGPYDPYMQLRDRELLVPEPDRRKELWPVLGRPGAVVIDGEVHGTWRPRASGTKLTVQVQHWRASRPSIRAAIEEQAERLAGHRGAALTGVTHG